jgi:cell division protein FtsL
VSVARKSGPRGRKRRPAPRARSHLRLADPSPRPRRLPFVVASCALIAPLVLGVVTVQTLVSQNAFRMRELSRQAVALDEGYRELRLEVAELSSPRRIAREAGRLGFQLPEKVHTISVEADSSGEEPPHEPSFTLKSVVLERP